METVGEERVRASQSLRQLEEAAVLLENASKSQTQEKITPGFPERVSGILNSLTAISSREDAERLLATGVSMWNAVIVFEGCELVQDTVEALVKVRHVAADCMYMSTTVLGGISARYNIDDLSLLKFYTACGQRYATDVSNMEMADVCFSKAAEFVEPALNESRNGESDKKTFARAMFDLLLGRAEVSWDKGDMDQAELFVSDARKYMDELPGEHEFLSSVEYNFGLFAYQSKETERSLKWLKRSMETRGSDANATKNLKKQAKTARLAGVCLLALQDYEESWKMMTSAQQMAHDPVGSYLLLKLSVITKKPDAIDILIKTIEDIDTSLDVCIASISLFGDAQRISDAAVGFEHLFARFKDDSKAISGTIGLRYFETLAALGRVEKALGVLDTCCVALARLTDNTVDIEKDTNAGAEGVCFPATEVERWSALLLATGSAQADRKDFSSAAKLLNRCLSLARSSATNSAEGIGVDSAKGARSSASNVVLENEAAVCRLASSCALCSIDDLNGKTNVTMDEQIGPNKNDKGGDDARQQLLEMSVAHAERAKSLEPSDFAPRLLLFRAYLVAKDFQKAALELRQASLEIRSFDPGALAEAACAARDVGSKPSVVAALRCILHMDPSTLSKNLVSSSASPPKGFFGKILLSCVHILLDKDVCNSSSAKAATEEDLNPTDDQCRREHTEDLLHVLRCGLRGIQKLGVEFAFDKEKEDIHDSLTYLTNVCWNRGRASGMDEAYNAWESFFDMCYQFSMLLPSTPENLQTRRMSKLMCASSSIENPEAARKDFERAKKQVREARRVSQMLQEVSPCAGEDPIEGLLLILESRCCVGCHDVDSLASVVELALQKAEVGAGVLEQLATVCYNCDGTQKESQTLVRCADLTAALLSKAGDVRLCDGRSDLSALAVTMREHLGIELSRGSTAARAYTVFVKAMGVVLENQSEFPMDERRWLVAVGWDRAQMYRRVGQDAEARQWCEGVKQLAEGCVALSAYVPRLDSFLGKLSTT